MEPLSAAASVIACYQLASEVGCQCFRYVRGVRNAQKAADLVVARIQMFQLSLHLLQGILANEVGNHSEASRLKFLHEIMNGSSASLVLCSKELEDLRAKLVKAQSGRNLKEVFHKLAWPLKQEEVDRAMVALGSFAAAIDRGLAMDSNEVVRGIDTTTKAINTTTKQILISAESAEAQQSQRERLRKEEDERQKAKETKDHILDWLAHPNHSEIHNIACHARKSTTIGKWFLDGAEFQTFKETPRSVLWLHGDSGCGKSVLCSAIIDELRIARLEKKPTFRLAYWYFSTNDANRRSLQNLVRALFTQLCPPCAAPPALIRLWKANRNGREAPQISDSVQALVQMLGETSFNESGPTFIVIDALDESNEAERTDIIDLLQRLVMLEIDMHLLVTSRSNTVGVEERLEDAVKLFNVVIEHQYADQDILTHITERLQNDKELNKWPSHLSKEIEEVLVANAAGMFRWVDCQLQAVSRCRKPNELRKALTSLPTTLREVYARELEKVPDSAVEDVRKLLGWLAYPQRPLRLEEAAEMLAVDLDSDPPGFDESKRMPRPEDILQICGSLVRIDTTPDGRDSLGNQADVQTLTAAHASVVDFVKENRVQIGPQLDFFYTRAAMNLEMAETCLIYLLNFVEGKLMLSDDNIIDYPLARFSAELWDDFYREAVASGESGIEMNRVDALVMRLFASPEVMLKWVQLCDPEHETHRAQFDLTISSVKSVMYYAALLGLPGIVSRLIEDGHHVDGGVDDDFGTPLVAACVHGRENVASILLENAADPNLVGQSGLGCPLAAAIEQNHTDIVKLLLKAKGVDLDARRVTPKYTRTARSKPDIRKSNIAAIGTEKRVELSEDMSIREGIHHDIGDSTNVSPDSAELPFPIVMTDKSARSLIYMAAKSGSLETVNALLEAGANPNVQGGPEYTALQAACRWGNADIVEALLKYGADVTLNGGKSGSPLQAACCYPSLRIVKILVEAKVDVNYVGDGNPCALYVATTAPDLEIVRPLLRYGAKSHLYGSICHNPLQKPSICSDFAIVQVLLRAGSDVDRKGGKFGTALNAACKRDSIDLVRLLLNHGADPNIQVGGEFDNALQIACSGENLEVVLLLLEHGADANLHGGRYGSALHVAFCQHGNEKVIRALLQYGADITYRGAECYSMLQAAVAGENVTAVNFALQYGFSPNEKDGQFAYPLLRAIYTETCPDSIVLLLLENGADPNLEGEGVDHRDRLFRTPLQHAATVSKATLLLDSGARINTVAGWPGTALHTAIYRGGIQQSSMIKLLIDRGADVNRSGEHVGTPLCYAAGQGELALSRLLVEAGADLQSVDIGGRSPLHLVICSPEATIEYFDYFVELGADPLLSDRRGCSGLHYAARGNSLDIVNRILKRVPDVNVIDAFGWTCLHWAVASTQKSAQVVKSLLDHGCNKDFKDNSGRTALDLAKKFNNADSIAILNNTGNAYLGPSNTDAARAKRLPCWYCDGCRTSRGVCDSEDWYTCTDCPPSSNLCFRCIEDKDVLHSRGHSWSSQPSNDIVRYWTITFDYVDSD